MQLIYRGIYRDAAQLPRAKLPANAVAFKEPDTLEGVNKKATLYSFGATGLMLGLFAVSVIIRGQNILSWLGSIPPAMLLPGLLLSFLLSFLTVMPHELLHAACFGKSAQVELFVSKKSLMAFVVSTHPITKTRFILMSLLPNVVFGWVPFIICTFLRMWGYEYYILILFSLFTISLGGGDYMNVVNTLRQMPKGSVQQMDGLNSYWYMPMQNEADDVGQIP